MTGLEPTLSGLYVGLKLNGNYNLKRADHFFKIGFRQSLEVKMLSKYGDMSYGSINYTARPYSNRHATLT